MAFYTLLEVSLKGLDFLTLNGQKRPVSLQWWLVMSDIYVSLFLGHQVRPGSIRNS